MAVAVGVLFVFDSPFIFCAQDIYMMLLASTIISLSIPLIDEGLHVHWKRVKFRSTQEALRNGHRMNSQVSHEC
jgi:hypothetical protein